jgi:hypothetical protein
MEYLVVMRLKDMHRRHPDQINSKKCSVCNTRVGIYPSGQRALQKNFNLKIICQVCNLRLGPSIGVAAPGVFEEMKESYSVDKKN